MWRATEAGLSVHTYWGSTRNKDMASVLVVKRGGMLSSRGVPDLEGKRCVND